MLEARPEVDVVFLAHAGFEGTADLNAIWTGNLIGRTVRLCFWRVGSACIPPTTDGRIEWLDAQWERVDAWVAAHSGLLSTHTAAATPATKERGDRATRPLRKGHSH